MGRRKLGIVVGILSASLAMACGESSDPVRQAVLWLSPRPALGETCTANAAFELPSTARTTLLGDGGGDRIVDGEGDTLIECTVADAGDGQNFNVLATLSSGVIGNFTVSGTLSNTSGGSVDVIFVQSGTGARLDGGSCTANVRTLISGALWVDALECEGLVDERSPNVACDASGAFIFENCSP